MNDQEKAETAAKTLMGFFSQFGDDLAAQILLEELFKGLMYEESLFVFGEPLERGDEIGDGVAERICDNIEGDGTIVPESTTDMATPDFPDYL